MDQMEKQPLGRSDKPEYENPLAPLHSYKGSCSCTPLSLPLQEAEAPQFPPLSLGASFYLSLTPGAPVVLDLNLNFLPQVAGMKVVIYKDVLCMRHTCLHTPASIQQFIYSTTVS